MWLLWFAIAFVFVFVAPTKSFSCLPLIKIAPLMKKWVARIVSTAWPDHGGAKVLGY